MKKIILVLVVIAAGYFIISNNKKEEGITPNGQQIEEVTTSWKSYGYVFALPSGWITSGADGGNMSLLIVSPEAGERSDSAGIIYRQRPCDFTSADGGTSPTNCITQEDFQKGTGTILSQEKVIFLGKEATKQVIDIGGQKFEKYYIKGLDFVSFSIPIGHRYESEIRKIVNSIKISPTREELESARGAQ